ncbi:UNVERIFIED_ORG: hypothetical protein FHW05_001977 [Pantoea agglomerans]|nr:hypothetical protein C7421_102448 [Pantoea ananatis]PWV91292.1 hypothetical protein C7426_102297 [Pantoea ananatis]REC92268.1 hypothetical protein C7423_102297 [Pantoea ananatis]REE79258.1 hypothetical protein C7424_0300 [Pantoea ananatis]
MSRYYFDKQVFLGGFEGLKKNAAWAAFCFSLAERTFGSGISSGCDLRPAALRDNVFSSNLH